MGPIRIQMPQEMFVPAAYKSYDESAKVGIVKCGSDIYDFAEPVHWQADITNTGDALLVTGTVEGVAKGGCARCLEQIDIPITGEIEGYFIINSEDAAPDDMEGDEFEYLPEDKTIDMAPLIQAAILLDLPNLPLCSEDCKGICPTCGADLNKEPCTCGESQEGEQAVSASKNPFAVLKDVDFG